VGDMADGQFKNKKQLVYIEDMDVRIQKSDDPKKNGKPWISFTIRGAEKDNEKCDGDVLFGLSREPLKDKKRDYESLGRFLVALGLPKKVDLGNLDKAVQPLINKIFEAKVEIRKGKSGGEFLNVTPLGFKGATAEKPTTDDAPF
jgi:hypothetical protein